MFYTQPILRSSIITVIDRFKLARHVPPLTLTKTDIYDKCKKTAVYTNVNGDIVSYTSKRANI